MNDLKFKREQMNEKLKQLRLLLSRNNGQLPADYIEWAKQNTVSEKSSEEVLKLRQREEELLKMIQDTAKELDQTPSRSYSFGGNTGQDPYYRSGENFHQNNSRIEREK